MPRTLCAAPEIDGPHQGRTDDRQGGMGGRGPRAGYDVNKNSFRLCQGSTTKLFLSPAVSGSRLHHSVVPKPQARDDVHGLQLLEEQLARVRHLFGPTCGNFVQRQV